MNLLKLFDNDSLLKTFINPIKRRHSLLNDVIVNIENKYSSLNDFSLSYKIFGVHQIEKDMVVTEWIPSVNRVFLVGDFNKWCEDHELKEIKTDVWQLKMENYDMSQHHMTKVKLKIYTNAGEVIYRVSPWGRFFVYNEEDKALESVIYKEEEYVFKNKRPLSKDSLKIYEAHVGISSCDPKVASYSHFTNIVLPRIKDLGYDTVQLMAIMEHAYYASFGYQVTNFFAPSSRYGKIEELKHLIDTAHGLGLRVLLDVVHSHASINSTDGLNMFNGTNGGFFHEGPRGIHKVWQSRLFNYSKIEVLQFLISNLRMWIEDFQFDGFRFDGVTSMLYYHHGLDFNFTGDYNQYFDLTVDLDSVVYFMLANHFLNTYFPFVTTICEDVSGMPTLCRPLSEGGFGFDYRLGMGIPDMWIKLMKAQSNWKMNDIISSLMNRRIHEKTIAYCESHDQALVGDKTLAFWLMDKNMYTDMSVFSPSNLIIERGLALLKMIRLITHCMGGNGYLNFIGNEFGHPEWLDFPCQRNKFSFHYARRQWNLVDDNLLKFKFLNHFDKMLNKTESEYNWLLGNLGDVIYQSDEEKVIVFTRKSCLFLFNFHLSRSYVDYKVGVMTPGKYKCVLNTDSGSFGGFDRIDESIFHFSSAEVFRDHQQHLMVYLPSTSAQVCVCVES